MPRNLLRLGAIVVVAVAGFVASSLSFEWVPAPARQASYALAAATAAGDVIETEPIVSEASLAGLSWTGAAPEAAWVRASADGVEWGDWVALGLGPDHGPDPGSAESETQRPASDPAYLGEVSHVQYRIKPTSDAEALEPRAVDRFTAELVDTSGRGLGLQQQAVRFLKSITLNQDEAADGSPSRPNIVPREAWGGDQCLTGSEPTPGNVHRVDVMFVHHAGNNGYAQGQEARDLIYAHCIYHVRTRGWWDVAYNFYVDRYGVIYEGRRGGVAQPIQGGHTGGFNSYSTGVAMLGNHDEGPVTQKAQASLVDLATWKLDLSNTEPTGTVPLMSLGSTRYSSGTVVTFDRLSGHRDASSTACPGTYCYNLMPTFRSETEAGGGLKIYADFQDFDPRDGTDPQRPPGPLGLQFTKSTSWNMEITDQSGSVVFATSGSGKSAQISWNGTNNGSLVPPGTYEATVRAGSARPVEQSFEVRPPIGSMVGLQRWWGRNRYGTAVDIAQHAYPDGADTVFIVTGLNFPDALATAPLAQRLEGPVLLVQPTSVPPMTAAEIKRLDPNRIYVLGGPGAVSNAVAAELGNLAPVTRLWGSDRYGTAAEISKAAFPSGSDIAYVAVGTNFADALVAAPVAADRGGPLLLTGGSSLHGATRRELLRLDPDTIVVLGARTVIGNTVLSQISALAPNVVEIGEPSRYSSAVKISQHAYGSGADVAFVATGTDYPDALSVGPIAAAVRGPILLVPKTYLPATVAAELARLDPGGVVILGGPGAVSPAVESAIAGIID